MHGKDMRYFSRTQGDPYMIARPVRTAMTMGIEDKIMRANELQKLLDDFYAWLESSPPLPEVVHSGTRGREPGRGS